MRNLTLDCLYLVTSKHRSVLILLVLAGLTFLVGCDRQAAPEQSAKDHLTLARFYITQGSLGSSIAEIGKTLQLEPGNAEAYRTLGEVYLAAGDGRSAEEALVKSIELGIPEPELRELLINAYLKQGKFQDAIGLLNDMGEVAAENESRITLLRGEALLGAGQIDESEALASAILAEEPGNAAATLIRAKVALAKGDIAAAEGLLGQALEQDPELVEGWLWKGRLASMREDYREAEKAFYKVRELDKTDILTANKMESFQNVIQAKVGQQKFEEAYDYYQEFLEFYPNSVLARYQQGVASLRDGNIDEAEEILTAVQRMAPNHLPSSLALGVIHFTRGDAAKASAYFADSLEAGNSNPMVVKMFAETQLRLNNPRAALDVLEPEMAKGEQPDPALLALYGMAAAAAGEAQTGREALEQAVALAPDNALFKMNLARIYLADRALPEARGQLDLALESGAPATQVHALRLASWLAEDDRARAAEELVQFVAALPAAEQPGAEVANLYRYASNFGGQAWTEQQFEQQVAKNGGPAAIRLALANIYAARGEAAAARAHVKSLLEAAPDNPDYRLLSGKIELAANEPDAALAEFERVLAVAEDSAAAMRGAAQVYSQKGEFNESARLLQQALRLDPNDLIALRMLGSVYLAGGNDVQAEALAERLERLHPASSVGPLLRGDLLASNEQWNSALLAYQRALELEPSGDTVLKLFGVLSRMGDLERATGVLSDWLTARPDDARARVLLAGLQLQTGDFGSAIENYERIDAEHPGNAVVLNNLAWLYGETGRPEALATARRAVAAAPGNAAILDTLGWLLVNNGELQEGIRILEEAAKADPGNADVQEHLAEARKRASS